MQDKPLISVITASLNQGKFIRHTIESVLAQGGDDWEHIVVDGGSNDDTISILESYPHLFWVSEEDRGQSDALNKAMKMSQGDLIFWINSDDVVAPGAFEEARRFFAAHPEAQIVCGNAVTLDEDGNETGRTGPRIRAHKLRYPWDGDTSVHQPSIVFRRTVFETVGPFDTTLHYAMDFDFYLRASGQFEFHLLPVDFGHFRGYVGTKTGGGAATAFTEVQRCLVRYVEEKGDGSPTWTRIRAYLAEACVWVNDAVENYRNSRPSTARRLLFRAGLRNPMSFFVLPHIYYRLHQILGEKNFDALRHAVSRHR